MRKNRKTGRTPWTEDGWPVYDIQMPKRNRIKEFQKIEYVS